MAEEKANFENGLERLQGVVEALERGELPLEQALALYKEGLTLAGDLGRRLDAAKNEVRIAREGVLQQFAAQDAAAAPTEGGEA